MAPNPFDYFAIQNTISKYCIALDSKDFNLLGEVFTEDVDARYPLFNNVGDLNGLIEAIEKRSELKPTLDRHRTKYSQDSHP